MWLLNLRTIDKISFYIELVTLNIPVVWFVEVAGELLFDKFFEHLLQYIDRKVEKVIAQPFKRRMPPRSPLRNYLLRSGSSRQIYLDYEGAQKMGMAGCYGSNLFR